MTTGAIISMLFAMVALWGGSAYCINLAMKSEKK
ncbi:MAG: hypothetical protein PWQ82_856 [Thermosediminibacterales bacterium]|nr:hypothetical protein [Thermosediminibacterales bacterium]MDK2835943.1 hypothetical protein [Thermosediminibacterales bacterium]